MSILNLLPLSGIIVDWAGLNFFAKIGVLPDFNTKSVLLILEPLTAL